VNLLEQELPELGSEGRDFTEDLIGVLYGEVVNKQIKRGVG
jgi:hypothetical protein